MRDFPLLASFATPFPRLCDGNYSPTSNSVGFKCDVGRAGLTLRAETIDTSVASSMAAQEPSGVYEAVLPQTETLVGMGFIAVLCVALYWVWENQVVPVSRTKLAISKNRGELSKYLDELKASSPASAIESSAQSSSASVSSETQTNDIGEPSLVQPANIADSDEGDLVGNQPVSPPSTPTRDRAFERWLFTDWLQDNKSKRKDGRQKEPALPILKSARWNSGDNPVVVAAFLMLVGLFVTALTERLASFG